jgi:heme/copper-type cytochrome/quinol oxidase subunit 3
MLIFLGAETMFFAGLIGAFVVYRVANETWPPMAMPRLPVEVTGLNTLILLYSAVTMWLANRAIRLGQQQTLTRMLLRTAVLGVIFLMVQGYEWVKLIGYGLTLSSGVYGATFYTLIGCHALHVLGAVVWLLSVWLRATRKRYTATRRTGVVLCNMYWSYVVGLWPILYWLVYLY